MLIHLNIINAVVKDMSIPTKYRDEKSSLHVGEALIKFPFKLMTGFAKRVFLKYFIYDFNMASVYILLGGGQNTGDPGAAPSLLTLGQNKLYGNS